MPMVILKVPLLQRKLINAINFDAHSDFRILEADTVATAFHAYEEGFLKNIVFGLRKYF
jgi:formiminoglutamase